LRPELFSILGVPFYAYRTFLTVAFIVGTLLVARESRRQQDGFVIQPTLGIWAYIGAIIGAKAFFILQYEDPWNLWRALLILRGGLVFYGGLIGGLVAVVAYLRVFKIPTIKALDLMAAYLPLGQAITRVGCFLNGCCFGTVCGLPWAVRFPAQSIAHQEQVHQELLTREAAHSLWVHPTQLYMVIGLTIIFWALKRILNRAHSTGAVCAWYCVMYGVLRFLVEFVRGDNAHSVLGLTVYQVVSLALIAGGLVVLAYLRTRPVPAHPAATSQE
jgi:phosphatidylglycerol---prolipoprotein diacylglyceryl transferase